MSVRRDDDRRGFRTVLLDRGEKRNAIDADMVRGISDALETAPGPVVVLASTDPSSFSSGADLGLSNPERAAVSDSLYALYQQMRRTEKIIIAAASGHAVGGGAQLLVASDLRIASPDLIIRFMGPGHGLVVGAWGLPSLIGRGRAVDLCLSMRPVDAEEALAIGLVDRVVEDALEAAQDYAAMVCRLVPAAVAAVKRLVTTANPEDALAAEREHNSTWDGSVDGSTRQEG